MSVGVQRLRDEPDRIRQGAIDKREDPSLVDRAIEVDVSRRRLQSESDAQKAERNTVSKQIGEAIRAGARPDGDEVKALRDASTAAGARIDEIDAELAAAEAELEDLLVRIPNPADPEVPVGGEEANVTVRTWGDLPAHDETGPDGAAWARKPHWELGESLDIIDNPRGAKVAGSGFPVYKGLGSRLQRSLISYFLDVHTTENGFTEVWPPAVVNTASARGTGQIPDKEDQMYVVTRDDLYLIPTSEVPVTNLHRDEILDASELPIRYAAYSPCFRREAGAAGKDTRGILRVHQFDKVEMVLFEKPEDSPQALEWMTERAEILLQRLGLAYRVLLISTGEMGFVQRKKYDLEVWAPGVERWLEVSSCSNVGDYQARRMAIRYRPEKGAKPELVHTLNGSGSRSPGSWPRSSRSTSSRTGRSPCPMSFGPTSARLPSGHWRRPEGARPGREGSTNDGRATSGAGQLGGTRRPERWARARREVRRRRCPPRRLHRRRADHDRRQPGLPVRGRAVDRRGGVGGRRPASPASGSSSRSASGSRSRSRTSPSSGPAAARRPACGSCTSRSSATRMAAR